jgi:phage-related protein
MASIYDTVPTWSAATTYNKYSIVKGSDNRFYYSIIDSNVGPSNNPVTPGNLQLDWDGYILLNGNLIPNFWWKPSYNGKINVNPRVKINKFGNGYEQRVVDGINNNLIEFDLTFENRSELETVSILHFLQQRNGQESFIYNVPTIFSKSLSNLNTRFVCAQWSPSYVSYNNYSIEAKFTEVPI